MLLCKSLQSCIIRKINKWTDQKIYLKSGCDEHKEELASDTVKQLAVCLNDASISLYTENLALFINY